MLSSLKILTLAILALLVFSCADTEEALTAETKGWSVEKLYAEANKDLENRSYSKAIKLYRILELTYPYGTYAQQGLLDLAYVYYMDGQPELAIPTVDQFIRLYPTNVNMDYALFLKGYINYKNDNGLLSRFTHQDLSERDPKSLQEAYAAFYELATKYPNSRFAPDARDKVNRLVNAMARGETYRARYYMQVKAYLAAIGRAQKVITDYPNTQYVEEALAIEVTAYNDVGSFSLSQKTNEVLALNFPKSEYLKHSWTYHDMAWYAFWR